ncbi:uncharacterized protein LOC128627671 [Artibeus jamaicensis]|uniref:uncharacterized protein LOC128627671 n=1 Tax=Artibeus jamaicensis TaxID=9417 RepID=UPI00235A97F9|nr:uncharacterized protein LOC128627671 [Artibeus jamaicensis]
MKRPFRPQGPRTGCPRGWQNCFLNRKKSAPANLDFIFCSWKCVSAGSVNAKVIQNLRGSARRWALPSVLGQQGPLAPRTSLVCDESLETDLVASVQVSAASGGDLFRKPCAGTPLRLRLWAAGRLTPPSSTELWQCLSKMCGQICLSTFSSSLQGGTGDCPRRPSGSHKSAKGLLNAEQAGPQPEPSRSLWSSPKQAGDQESVVLWNPVWSFHGGAASSLRGGQQPQNLDRSVLAASAFQTLHRRSVPSYLIEYQGLMSRAADFQIGAEEELRGNVRRGSLVEWRVQKLLMDGWQE